MNEENFQRLETSLKLLTHPIADVRFLVKADSSSIERIKPAVSLLDRTYLCLTCDTSPPQSVVFFLGASNDCIDALILREEEQECYSAIYDIVRADDSEVHGLSVFSAFQLVNPVFNYGSCLIEKTTILTASVRDNVERVIGIVFDFPFGIRLGLIVFDDHRLSICFNEVCDTIVNQGRANKRVRVVEKELAATIKPRFSEIDWFDWLE